MIWKKTKAFLIAWATGTFVAAVTYLISSMASRGKFYNLYELMYGLVLESALAAIPVLVIGLSLTLLVIRFRISVILALVSFVLLGAISGAFVFDYVAGGTVRDWLLGGALPGAVSGFAFVLVMRLTKLGTVDGQR